MRFFIKAEASAAARNRNELISVTNAQTRRVGKSRGVGFGFVLCILMMGVACFLALTFTEHKRVRSQRSGGAVWCWLS